MHRITLDTIIAQAEGDSIHGTILDHVTNLPVGQPFTAGVGKHPAVLVRVELNSEVDPHLHFVSSLWAATMAALPARWYVTSTLVRHPASHRNALRDTPFEEREKSCAIP
jgi:hypothetical protein